MNKLELKQLIKEVINSEQQVPTTDFDSAVDFLKAHKSKEYELWYDDYHGDTDTVYEYNDSLYWPDYSEGYIAVAPPKHKDKVVQYINKIIDYGYKHDDLDDEELMDKFISQLQSKFKESITF